MDIKLSWYDDNKTILVYIIEGQWDWQVLYNVYQQGLLLKRSVAHRVDVIVDIRASGRLPQDCISHARMIAHEQPPNGGISIIVTQDRFVHILYQAARRIDGQIRDYFRIASTPEEALMLIASCKQSC